MQLGLQKNRSLVSLYDRTGVCTIRTLIKTHRRCNCFALFTGLRAPPSAERIMAESVVVGDKVGHSDNAVNGKASDKKES